MINNYIEALLLNVLFLIVFLIFIPMLIKINFKNNHKLRGYLIVISGALAIISCMSFPIQLTEEVIVDLRGVAIVLFGMYYGNRVAFMLTSIVVIYRFFEVGIDVGFYSTLILGLILLVFIIVLKPFFKKASRREKIIIGCTLIFGIGILSIVVLTYMYKVTIFPTVILVFLLIGLTCTFFIFYFFELVQETIFVIDRIIKGEKMEVISHLASSISHEVRNPLTVVKGFLQIMQQAELPKEKRREFIELSLQEIDRANDIISNYLTFAKPAPTNVKLLDIKQELHRALEIIKPLANMNCVEIESKIETFYLKGETQLFQQCLLNITKNCIEAMPEGGKIVVETIEEKDSVIIKISDNGMGMTSEQLSRLGEPYFTTKGREGTGLGMITVIKITEILNGNLKVTSEVDKGTNFYLSFPIMKSQNSKVVEM